MSYYHLLLEAQPLFDNTGDGHFEPFGVAALPGIIPVGFLSR